MANYRRKRSRRHPRCVHRDYIPKRHMGNDVSRRSHGHKRQRGEALVTLMAEALQRMPRTFDEGAVYYIDRETYEANPDAFPGAQTVRISVASGVPIKIDRE